MKPPPALSQVTAAIEDITVATGKMPSILHLARHLRMPNTTFRRTYPDIVADLQRQRTSRGVVDASGSADAFEQLTLANKRLRRRNHDLQAQLDLACANIQQLAITNHQLQRALESAKHVAPLRHHRSANERP